MKSKHQNDSGISEAQSVEVALEEKSTAPVEPVNAVQKVDALGVVTNCKKLNVREAPSRNAGIVAVIPVGSEVTVDRSASTDEFYKISNAASIQGFCMKQFVILRN